MQFIIFVFLLSGVLCATEKRRYCGVDFVNQIVRVCTLEEQSAGCAKYDVIEKSNPTLQKLRTSRNAPLNGEVTVSPEHCCHIGCTMEEYKSFCCKDDMHVNIHANK
ncbi:hypothetical protein M3Y94_00672700 [Aphelenchoides besseyi]|nr:hypothetical protein M3Y94_00672700 [Aphelenchoides besseyi]KAI6231358.1 hypothetical protein M3Y95_00373100 [Aphelenchoides besseyi]